MADVEFKDTTGIIVWKDIPSVAWVSVALAGLGLGIEDINAFDNVADVSPHDTNNLTKGGIIFIGTGGNIKVDMIGVGTVTFLNVPNGRFISGRVKRVYSTGTTASDIIVIF